MARLTGQTYLPTAQAQYYHQDGQHSVVALSGRTFTPAENLARVGATTLATTGDYSAGYPPAQLHDGITVPSNNRGWVGRTDWGASLAYGFPSRPVDRVVLHAVPNYRPAAYTVQVQTASGWQSVASGTDADFVAHADGSVVATQTFPPIQATGLKVTFTAGVNPPHVWLTEAQVWSTPSGEVTTQRFDAFGTPLAQTGPIPTYGYTGREPDATGLIYYRARYYDPALGRFTQRDPLGYTDGLNPYAYVHDNPLNLTDPNGLLARQVAHAWESGKTYFASGQFADAVGETASAAFATPGVQASLYGGTVLATGGATGSYLAGNRVATTLLGVGLEAHNLASNDVPVLSTRVEPVAAKGGVWSLGPGPRGLAIESQMGGNLPAGFPVVDKFANGVVISIKSIDLNAATYQNAQALASRLNGYVDSLAGFNGAVRAGQEINAAQITARQLQLAIPPGSASAAQQAVINAAAARAQGMGVNLIVTPFP